jgi:hypothetical protein
MEIMVEVGYSTKEMHEMVSNVLVHSTDERLINNILDALEDRNYKGAFQGFEADILDFNSNYKNQLINK